MHILILGGFLGSGKTSIIRLLIRGLVNSGLTCAIVENEIGEVGIDDVLLEEAEIKVTPLFGGCVCCQISGDLIVATQKIHEEVNPDWIIVEMTGLALMDSMRDLFEKYGNPEFSLHTVSVVDLSRWKHLVGALSIVFEQQVAGADVILLNKIDVAEPTEETYETLERLDPGAPIIKLDESLKEPDILWKTLLEKLEEARPGAHHA